MWLRISVKLENETWKTLPRQEIGSAPYALHAGDGVPPGAVMAFDLEQCPHGWSEHMPARGRTLIGVNPTVENGLSPRALGESTGAEVHVLSEEQMPKHKHTISAYDVVNADFDWADTGLVVEGGKKTGQYAKGYGSTHTSEKGGAPHNNMQPSLALLYCKKL